VILHKKIKIHFDKKIFLNIAVTFQNLFKLLASLIMGFIDRIVQKKIFLIDTRKNILDEKKI